MSIQTLQFTSTREPLAAAWGGEILDNLLSRPTVRRTEEGSLSSPRPPFFPKKTRPRQHCYHSKPGFTAAQNLGVSWWKMDLFPTWRSHLSTDGWTTSGRSYGHQASCSQSPSPSPAFPNLGCGSGWCKGWDRECRELHTLMDKQQSGTELSSNSRVRMEGKNYHKTVAATKDQGA